MDGKAANAVTEDEARKLATRMIDTWPSGPKGYIWQNELKALQFEHAAEAFRLLRQETDKATTAQFHQRYRAVAGKANVLHVPARCEMCNGTGWAEATPAEAHEPRVCTADPGGTGCFCHAVKPCRCTNAAQAHRIVDLIHGQRYRDEVA
jgi:hypothetical protein